MDFSEEYVRSVKNRAAERLFSIPGVVGLALGPKSIGGKRTSTPAIQVFVETKRPVAELVTGQRIPSFIEDINTDVLEATPPVEATSTIRCRQAPITKAEKNSTGLIEITSAGHGLTTGQHVRVVGIEFNANYAYPITATGADTFTLPTDVDLLPSVPRSPSPFWMEVCSFDDGMCCCQTGQITDAVAGNPVKITSPGHGLASGDRIKIARIAVMTQLRGKEFVIGKTTKDTFELKVDGRTYPMGTESGAWERLCISRSGEIQGVTIGNPVVFTSHGHPLRKGDRVHVLNNWIADLSSSGEAEPWTVSAITSDTFSVEERMTVSPHPPSTVPFIGCWIRVHPDGNMYSRARGGIRLAMSRDSVLDKKPLIDVTSTTQGSKTTSEPTIVTTDITFGTLGCLAIQNGTNNKVLVSNYHVLYSITDEDNVHHPTYSSCKSHKIAERLTHAPQGTPTNLGTVDAAIAKLTSPGDADPVILDIGPVAGSYTITLSDILWNQTADTSYSGYRVRKRGITTLLTVGIVTSIDFTYNSDSKSERPVHLRNQIVIDPINGVYRGAFSLKGDSGSALVNDDNMVVGLVHAADGMGHGFACPIADVESQLKIKILAASGSADSGGGSSTDEVVSIPPIPDLVASIASDVSATARGAQLFALALKHQREVQDLVHHNRRMTVAWHRNAGPSILRELHAFVVRRDVPLPEQINGLSTRSCVKNFFDSLSQCGSPTLVADVETHRSELEQLAQLSYVDMLGMLSREAAFVG